MLNRPPFLIDSTGRPAPTLDQAFGGLGFQSGSMPFKTDFLSNDSSARRNAGPRLVCADLEISISTYFSLHCLTYKISTIVLCFALAYFLFARALILSA